jgi:hypothetical protein
MAHTEPFCGRGFYPRRERSHALLHLDAGRLVLENVFDLCPEEACLKAVTDILDVHHHVYFIEVQDVRGNDEVSEQVAVNDPYDRLGDVQRLNDGRLMTVKIPGFAGDYVMVIFPFAE